MPAFDVPSEACAILWHMKIHRTRLGLYLLCIARAGYVGGGRLVEFIEDWRRVVERHGGPITIEQYIEDGGRLSRRTTFRRVALFRSAFPELGDEGLPDALMGPLLDRLTREAAVGLVVADEALPVPGRGKP
jgi:hypothetical protein